jgi:hypothetical protein
VDGVLGKGAQGILSDVWGPGKQTNICITRVTYSGAWAVDLHPCKKAQEGEFLAVEWWVKVLVSDVRGHDKGGLGEGRDWVLVYNICY